MNVCDSDMLYEDYKKDTYSDQRNKLKWKPTTANDYILTNSNNCLEYKYYGNQLSVVHPGVLANIYLKPSKYILEIEARTLPINSIYNDAFLYRRLTTKKDIHYNINNFKQKTKYKISPNTFSKIKMEFDIPYCYNGYETEEGHEGWSVLQCGIVFNDPKNMLKHGHLEILNICIMDIGVYRQPEPTYATEPQTPNTNRGTKLVELEEKILEMESKLLAMESAMLETNKKVEGLMNTSSETDCLDNVWDILYDTEGNIYYLNNTTHESSWVLPEGAKLRNKKVVPPLPPRATSPITIQELDDESGDYIPDLFEQNTIVPTRTPPDLLSAPPSYMKHESAKIYPAKPSELPYEEQMKLALIESLNIATG